MTQAQVLTFEDHLALSRHAAEQIVDIARRAILQRGRFTMALSGGSTPKRLYELLAHQPFATQIDWGKTHIFWADERCVPPHNEESNYHLAHEALLKHMPIPAEQVHRLKGELDPEQAAQDYAQQLLFMAQENLAWPQLDIAILGMGTDGHTASLFPNSPTEMQAPVITAVADYDGRPAQRLTLTPPVLNSSRNVFFLVTGTNKAATLAAVLRGPYQPQTLPAQRIQPTQGQLWWLVDKAAAAQL